MAKKDTQMCTVITDYATRNLMIRGIARRILSARYVSPDSVPSFSTIINEVIESKLNITPEQTEVEKGQTKKTMIMLFLTKKLHQAFTADGKYTSKSGPELLTEIINQTDFANLDVPLSDDDMDDEKVGCSFRILSEVRTKLYKEIARTMLMNPHAVGQGQSVNIGRMINEMLAAHYNIAIKRNDVERFVDHEQMKMTVLIETKIHDEFKKYCEKLSVETGEYVSMNKKINDWVVELAQREMW